MKFLNIFGSCWLFNDYFKLVLFSSDLIVQVTRVSCFYMQDDKERLPKLLDYAVCLIHLAVFGILGVICTIYMHTPFSLVYLFIFLNFFI